MKKSIYVTHILSHDPHRSPRIALTTATVTNCHLAQGCIDVVIFVCITLLASVINCSKLNARKNVYHC